MSFHIWVVIVPGLVFCYSVNHSISLCFSGRVHRNIWGRQSVGHSYAFAILKFKTYKDTWKIIIHLMVGSIFSCTSLLTVRQHLQCCQYGFALGHLFFSLFVCLFCPPPPWTQFCPVMCGQCAGQCPGCTLASCCTTRLGPKVLRN